MEGSGLDLESHSLFICLAGIIILHIVYSFISPNSLQDKQDISDCALQM